MKISPEIFDKEQPLYTIVNNKLVKITKVCTDLTDAIEFEKKDKDSILVSTHGGVAFFSTITEAA